MDRAAPAKTPCGKRAREGRSITLADLCRPQRLNPPRPASCARRALRVLRESRLASAPAAGVEAPRQVSALFYAHATPPTGRARR